MEENEAIGRHRTAEAYPGTKRNIPQPLEMELYHRLAVRLN